MGGRNLERVDSNGGLFVWSEWMEDISGESRGLGICEK